MNLEELLMRPEGKTLEFKQDLSSPKNIFRTLTAFANMAGGPLRAEMRPCAVKRTHDKEPMGDIDPEALDFRVASRFFAGLRKGERRALENLRFISRHQGRPDPVPGSEVQVEVQEVQVEVQEVQVEVQEAHVEAQEAHVLLTVVEKAMLYSCKSGPRSSRELLETAGYSKRTGNFKASLSKLLAAGLIKMTIPEKPRSTKQRYDITPAGIAVLSKYEKEPKL